MKTTISFLLAMFIYGSLLAQSTQELMYQAYLNRSAETWKKAVDLTAKELTAKPNDPTKQMDLAYAYFSLLNGSMAMPNDDLFDEYISDAKKFLKKIVEDKPKSGEAAAMLSSIYGNEIGKSPMKGMLLGSKSSSLAEKGILFEPNSPLAWSVYASNKYYTPSSFGGDLQEAIKGWEKTIQLSQANAGTLKDNWLYLNAIVFLGQAYEKAGSREKAIAAYEKALVVEPQFQYAKMLLNKIKNTSNEKK
ncbi:MAG: tetratricopeptide repeat protein [Bacteroidetes bacterium]|nr:tetratricopeptide repeat protein [Bacteroidota bacterium]